MQSFLNLKIVTVDRNKTIYDLGYLTMDEDVIVAIGAMEDYKSQQEPSEDCTGMIAIPGLINAHTHLGLIPLRSLGEDMPDRLRRYIFPMEQAYMSETVVVASSRYAALESLLNGTTTVADMYFYADAVAEALDKVGIRSFVGQTILRESQIDYQTEDAALEATASLIQKWKNHHMIQPMIAPHSPVTVSESVLRNIAFLSQETETKVMIHVSEMDYEMEAFLPLSPIEYLDSIGFMSHHVLGVHAIHTTEHDQMIFRNRNASVVHCPGANMKSGKGITDLKGFTKHHVNIALGTDGPISGNTLDLQTVMKLVAMGQKTKYRERDIFPSESILEMATIHGAKALGIDAITGSLEVGKKADIVLIDTESANMFPIYHPVPSIIYQSQPQNVHTVIVNGVPLVKNHKLVNASITKARQDLQAVIRDIAQQS